MARTFLSGIQIPTLPRLNIDGDFTLDAQTGTSGQVLASQGGGTPAWTNSINLLDPLLLSVSTVGGGGTEGGQINFARVTDGLRYWNIDSFGATTTPDLRFIEDSTERFRMVAGGTLLVGSTLNLTTTGITTVNTSGNSGAITISSGTTSNGLQATSGSVTIGTGAGAGSGNNSGAIVVRTGAGSGSTGSSGSVTIDSGALSGAGTAGAISIGTTNASAITIGRSGLTTTVGGNLTADQVFSTNNGAGTNFKVGDDAWIGDINVADTIGIRGQQSAANGYLTFGNADNTALGRASTGALTYGGEKVASASKVFSRASATTSSPAPGTYTVNIFAAANDVLSGISAATTYAFRAKFYLSTSYSSGTYSVTTPLTFSNAPASIKYSFKTYPETPGSTLTRLGAGTSVTIAPLAGSLSGSVTTVVEIDGYFNSHATLSSTLTPQLTCQVLSGSTTATISTGSWIEIEKLGTSTQTLIAGSWA